MRTQGPPQQTAVVGLISAGVLPVRLVSGDVTSSSLSRQAPVLSQVDMRATSVHKVAVSWIMLVRRHDLRPGKVTQMFGCIQRIFVNKPTAILIAGTMLTSQKSLANVVVVFGEKY
ncbi:uncharacterized protein RAG0_05824 [Rhynchosporium agropyri]|uniref:Uncharacterized protein n=1 Tax=Rhynchosporium agropyri TaxID=914238 RepID=A0A1E1KID2_9HELO|nr:uncharacterized protein RAG0_05824 [Rhynchosporium agropyri]